jgi:predicted RNase H-like HicB family nuclease
VDKRRYHVLLEWDPEDHVWVTFVPALNDLSTFGETREEALANTQEAIEGYLEAAAKEGIVVPTYDTRRPVHSTRDLPAGTLRSILRQADIDAEDLIRFFHD